MGSDAKEAGAAGVRIGAGDDRPTVVVVDIGATGDGKTDVVTAGADAFGQRLQNQQGEPEHDLAE